jgi:hypothetical protein
MWANPIDTLAHRHRLHILSSNCVNITLSFEFHTAFHENVYASWVPVRLYSPELWLSPPTTGVHHV